MSIVKRFLLLFCLLILLIQFVRPQKNSGDLYGSEHISRVVEVPENIKLILNAACNDCHSNNTKSYWYSEIMPIGWWLNHHVEEGKEELNFSEFASYSLDKQDDKLEEIKEVILEKEMPLESYRKLHKEARLTEVQINLISVWVDSSRDKISQRGKK